LPKNERKACFAQSKAIRNLHLARCEKGTEISCEEEERLRHFIKRIGCLDSKDVNKCIDEVDMSLKYALIECKGGDACLTKANEKREAKKKVC
jgi:hypothetical protein